MQTEHNTIYKVKANSDGELLINALERSGLPIESICGGAGKCGKCKVKIVRGAAWPHLPEELEMLDRKEIENGIRLSCLCHFKGEADIVLPQSENEMQIQVQGKVSDFHFDPIIQKRHIVLEPKENESLYDCLCKKVKTETDNPLDIVQSLGVNSTSITLILHQDRLIGIETGDTADFCYGVAVDIGTTTVAAELIDLNTASVLSTKSILNPQFAMGSDVLSRIHLAQQHSKNFHKLTRLIQDAIKNLITSLFESTKLNQNHCYLIYVAGNTTMLHLFMGTSPSSLGYYPYRAIFLEPLQIEAAKLNIKAASCAVVQTLPSINSFIGADITSGIMALDLDNAGRNVLFLDIGTNGEIVICYNGTMVATSTAAGPALEGMNISCGMKATAGAIEKVDLSNGHIAFKTIGDITPSGLCGTGLLDLVAVLLQAGVIQSSGRITTPEKASLNGVMDMDGSRRFQLIEPCPENENGIYLTQKDVRQIQLSKGAMTAGIKILLDQAGLSPSQIDTVYIAGGFGYYLNTETLIALGLFPKIWRDRLIYAGNTSLSGTRLSILNKTLIGKHAEKLKSIAYCDLNHAPNFNHVFARSMIFDGSIF